MIPQRQSRLSLRSRLILWQFVVLAPLLLAMMFHQFYLMPRYHKPLLKIAEEITQEVLQIKSLQLVLLTSAMPVNDYLIHGNRLEINNFAWQRHRVDEDFSAIRIALFGEDQKRQLVESAWQEWGQAKTLADELLGIVDPVGKPELGAKMERFDQHIDAASTTLEAFYKLARHEINMALLNASTAHVKSENLTIASFILALVFSALLGKALTHSILRDLKSLYVGASQVADGQFDQKVHAGGFHELEELSDAFNAMAAKLQVHDAALQDMATHDVLTGLGNRRAFDMRLEEEWQRAKRYGHPLSLLMLDIDHFKRVNDTHGHPAGDAVLRKLGATINSVVRPVDYVFRYGGEEFVVLMPETHGNGALSLAERIRQAVAATSFGIKPHKNIYLTLSIGVATCPGSADTKEALVTAADHTLYQAKQSGRNRVCMQANAA